MALFFDMDGTLTIYNVDATLADYKTPGYYLRLAPTELAGYVNNLAVEETDEVYISSGCHPQSTAMVEKDQWNDDYVPNVDRAHRLYVPYGESKASFAEAVLQRPLTRDDILVDDHTPNLIQWEEAGGTGIKWLNTINGLHGRFKGHRTGTVPGLESILMRRRRGQKFDRAVKLPACI